MIPTTIEIPGTFPDFNKIIKAAKQGRGEYQPYALMKDEYTQIVAWCATRLPKYGRVDITITWWEPNRKRDPDGIMAGTKFIMDGLVQAGTIKNDSQRYVRSITHRFGVDQGNPRVEIEVEEVEEERP